MQYSQCGNFAVREQATLDANIVLPGGNVNKHAMVSKTTPAGGSSSKPGILRRKLSPSRAIRVAESHEPRHLQ